MIGQTDAMTKPLVRVPRQGAAPRTRRPPRFALMLEDIDYQSSSVTHLQDLHQSLFGL